MFNQNKLKMYWKDRKIFCIFGPLAFASSILAWITQVGFHFSLYWFVHCVFASGVLLIDYNFIYSPETAKDNDFDSVSEEDCRCERCHCENNLDNGSDSAEKTKKQ